MKHYLVKNKKHIGIIITSILFCFYTNSITGQATNFPYKLKGSDYAVAAIGISTISYANHLKNKKETLNYNEINQLNASKVNSFDRSATYNWNINLDYASDISAYVLASAPSVLLFTEFKNKNWSNSITYGVMYFETAMLTFGITNLTKFTTKRTRPYLYNTSLSITEKTELSQNNTVNDSFFSGHTAIAFSTAVFLSKTYTDIFGKNRVSKIIWGSSIAVAGGTGFLRYKAGQHFPTDIIIGAIVGSGIGYLIPVLHKIETSQNLSFSIFGSCFNIAYHF